MLKRIKNVSFIQTYWHLTLAVSAAVGCSTQTDAEPLVEEAQLQPLERAPRVELADGIMQSEKRDGSSVFIGIPYAAPPIGELRWKPPAAVEPWDDVLETTGPGRKCLQFVAPRHSDPPAAPSGGPVESEDCLQLNVFAPEHKPAAPVPVLVWLHGGSNAVNSANDESAPGVLTYDGARLRSAAPREVIVVSVNYRLGPLGFLAHPALSDESSEGVSGNYGLLDQQAALRWVQKNIAAFGGDADNVTLFGQSAGSMDTCYQAVLQGSKGLFHRVIVQSGSCALWVTPIEQAETKGAAWSDGFGCAGDHALECLRAKPADLLQTSRPPREYPGAPFFLNPDPSYEETWSERDPGQTVVVDGVYLKEQPIAAFAAGRYARVPAIIGTTAREAADSYTEGTRLFQNEAQYRAGIQTTFPTSSDAILQSYPVDRYPALNEATIEVATDYFFACPAWQLARRLSQYSDVYLYSWTRGVNTPEYAKYGAAHSVELVWQWDLWSAVLGAPAVEAPLVTQTADYWTAFAESGDPNRKESPSWPKYVAGEDQELNINVDLRVEKGRRDARCPLWSKVFAAEWGEDWAEH